MPADNFALNVPGSLTRPGAIEAAAKIRFLVLDVDGVCTDGRLLYHPDGAAEKFFNAQDGIGIKSAIRAGLGIGVITGRNDPCVQARFTQLGATAYMPGFDAKLDPLNRMCSDHALCLDQVAYMGDDWIDLDPMRSVGLPVAVANARPEVKDDALYVTGVKGGEGAVREVVEFLFACRKDGTRLADLWTEVPVAQWKK